MPEPRLEDLTRRLADCPPEFLLELPDEEAGLVNPGAVLSDALAAFGGPPLAAGEAKAVAQRRGARLAMTAAWLLGHDSFAGRAGLAPKAKAFLLSLAPLAAAVEPGLFVTDADRREELARLALRALGLRAAGESAAQAEDRLAALDSLETRRTAELARAAQERAREVREAMKRKAAEEAAAKASRE